MDTPIPYVSVAYDGEKRLSGSSLLWSWEPVLGWRKFKIFLLNLIEKDLEVILYPHVVRCFDMRQCDAMYGDG